MNMNKINIRILAILVFLLSACNQELLDKTPLDRYSDATVWTDIDLATSYLNYCYNSARVGDFWDRISWSQKGIMKGAVADEMVYRRGAENSPYNLGQMSPDNTGGRYGPNWFINSTWDQFANIQRINIFISKIDEVAEAYDGSVKAEIKKRSDILKGEALFLRAFLYTEMCRTYGGLPILDRPSKLGDDYLSITRATFEKTVSFIVKDCDDAAQLLPLKSDTELGRATREAALAVKSRMLLFAASDLTADGTAQNELVGYASPNRTALWTAARDAAKAVMDIGTNQLADFGAPDKDAVAQNYFDFFKVYDLSNKEIIWGVQYDLSLGSPSNVNEMNGPNGNLCFGNNGTLQGMVDEYEMEDGSKFSDHFTLDDNNFIKNTSTKYQTENPYYNREPRFYASILHDSAVWQPRFPSLIVRDPLGIYEVRTRIIIGADGTETIIPGIDTQQGPLTPGNGARSGYITKKFMDPAIIGSISNNENVWIEFRYAEILLNFAEASLELNDIPTATTYINMIRNRAGLPDFTGDITEALRHERKVELFAEGKRWYDIRRWKIMPKVFVPGGMGIKIVETYYEATNQRSTTWQVQSIQPANVFKENMYWIPIARDEMNRAPQLVQNPGY